MWRLQTLQVADTEEVQTILATQGCCGPGVVCGHVAVRIAQAETKLLDEPHATTVAVWLDSECRYAGCTLVGIGPAPHAQTACRAAGAFGAHNCYLVTNDPSHVGASGLTDALPNLLPIGIVLTTMGCNTLDVLLVSRALDGTVRWFDLSDVHIERKAITTAAMATVGAWMETAREALKQVKGTTPKQGELIPELTVLPEPAPDAARDVAALLDSMQIPPTTEDK